MRVTGNLRSRSVADVASQVSGRVEKVFVWQGDTVEKGATLVTLDTRRVRKSMAVLQARKAVQMSIRAIRLTELQDAEADVQAYLRALAETCADPGELLAGANRLFATSDSGHFVTMFLGRLWVLMRIGLLSVGVV